MAWTVCFLGVRSGAGDSHPFARALGLVVRCGGGLVDVEKLLGRPDGRGHGNRHVRLGSGLRGMGRWRVLRGIVLGAIGEQDEVGLREG